MNVMNKTLLKFPSPVYLSAFRKYSKAKTWEVSLSDMTAFCDCSSKEVTIACQDFQAVVMTTAEKTETSSETIATRKAHLTAILTAETSLQAAKA